MNLRPATMEDAELLLAWRNDPSTRRASFNASEIDLDTHKAWLTRKVHLIQVAEVDGVPVGQVRIDEGEISYSIDAQYRGKGYGKAMVKAVMGDAPLTARVKTTNVASCVLLEHLGWRLEPATGHLLYAWN